jgi:hypothetical protein
LIAQKASARASPSVPLPALRAMVDPTLRALPLIVQHVKEAAIAAAHRKSAPPAIQANAPIVERQPASRATRARGQTRARPPVRTGSYARTHAHTHTRTHAHTHTRTHAHTHTRMHTHTRTTLLLCPPCRQHPRPLHENDWQSRVRRLSVWALCSVGRHDILFEVLVGVWVVISVRIRASVQQL